MHIRTFVVAIVALLGALLFQGCSRKSSSFRVGVIAGPEEQVAQVAAKLAAEREGLVVELVVFNDYVTPNAALADGSIDLNAFQHAPFLGEQIKDRGYKLVAVGNTFVYPIAVYSKRFKQVEALPQGAKVAIPNDPTNRGRALHLLASRGLLKLKPGTVLNATVQDIQSTKADLHVIEIEAPLLPRTLEDVDLAVINTTYATQAGLNPNRDGLFIEGKDSPYVNLLVTREALQNADTVKRFVRAYQSEEVWAEARKVFGDAVVKGW